MTVCAHCGREARPQDRYCQACGQELPAPENMSEPANASLQQAFAYGPADARSLDPSLVGAPLRAPTGAPVATATATTQARVIVRSTSDSDSGDHRDEREYSLDGRDIAVGRAPSCDIVLSGDQLASRRHALLRNKGRHYTIVDLGSSNGTYVNDLEIREETVLHDRDYIKIGGHELVYSTGPAGPNASHAGVSLGESGPQSPLLETTPSMASISFAGAAPGPALDADQPAAPDEIQRADQAFIIAHAGGASSSEPLGEMPAMPVPQMPGSHAMQTAGPTSSLDTLRAQLAEVSAALAAQVDAEAQVADQLRAAISGVRDDLDVLLRMLVEAAPDAEDLVTIARQAAENPRHLDYVTALATHAGEIADALEARQPMEARADVREALEALRDRLDELLL
jgi:pSer/pThr/pTyr-binding forkhead associated (FHA) protein